MNGKFLCACILALGLNNLVTADINTDPWQINFYALSNIGTENNSYFGASIEGIAGSGGNAYLKNIGLNTSGPAATYAMYTGGNLSFQSSSSNAGGINTGGSINYGNSSVTGTVSAGGNLSGNSGTISGDVKLGGSNLAGPSLVINGTVSQNQPVTGGLNVAGVNSYFQNASSYWSGLQSTASWTNVYGQIVVTNLQAGRNIVNLTLADINNSWGIQLSGPSNAFVVFNINDTSGSLKNVVYDFSGGIGINDIMFNLANSTSLSLNGGTYASVLAPTATVTFGSGMLQGNLVANNLMGNGSIMESPFTGFAADQANFVVAAPEPSTYLFLGTTLTAVLYFKRKREKISS